MEFSELFFLELKDVLNEVHGMDASLRFWKLVAEDHLLAEVLRKDNLREAEWRGRPEWFAVVNFSNYPTFYEKVRNTGGRLQRYLKSRSVKNDIVSSLRKKNHFYIGFEGLPLPEAEDPGTAVIERYYPFIFGKGDSRKRDKVNVIAGRYDSQFLRNVIRRIPKIYIENFDTLYNSVELHDPEKKTFHVHVTDSLFETMMIAKYTEEGSKLIWYQHGCYYGEVVHKYRGYFEHSTGDVFRTWGYREHDIDEPWSAYRLESFKRKFQKYPEDNIYDLMICYSVMGGHNRKHVVQFTNTLLEKLYRDKYKTILARPRPVNSRVKASSQLNFITDERVTVAPDGSSIAKQVAESRIVLQMRVPSTNFLECIYCNQPVIGLIENNQPTEIIKPYYAFFKETGVLHENMNSVAEFLNETDIAAWWREVTGSAQYQSYKKKFANSRKFEGSFEV